jgi:hypothetical protein
VWFNTLHLPKKHISVKVLYRIAVGPAFGVKDDPDHGAGVGDKAVHFRAQEERGAEPGQGNGCDQPMQQKLGREDL